MHDGELPGAAGQRYQPVPGLSVGGWSLAFVGLFVANEQAQRVIGVGLGHAVLIQIKLPRPSEGRPRRFKRDIELWEQKWLYQHLRSTTYNAPNAKETGPFEQRKNTLWESIDSLKLVYPVDINTQRLDEISSRIDLTNTTQIQLFKQNSNRMAFPMLDPNWKKKQ